ncbi:LamG domain-containing protein [Streptomyces sp. NPDC001288]|uniref:LamG domain-containing protein n=1 Tax=unclassified Streptomyces TaxID=2593676 RepID=UPI00331D3DAF
MPRSGERERSTREYTAAQPGPSKDVPATDDLTLARLAAPGGGEGTEAAAAELAGRHLTAVLAYAGECTVTDEAAALLTTAAMDMALLTRPVGGADTAWRPHVLAAVLRVAAEWLRDERRRWLDAELAAHLPHLVLFPEPDDPQPPAVTAFNRMPVRFQAGLWHLVVENENENEGAEAVALHLGADAAVVRTWMPTVEDRFRSALIEVYEECAAPACRPFSRILVTASETDPTRALATRASSGLDEHLATCADCARTLDDLTRLNGPERGASLAEALLPWGGRRYFESRSADGADVRAGHLPAPAPGGAPVRGRGGRVSRCLRSARKQRAVLIPLGVCTAITVVVACMGAPQFVEAGRPFRPTAHDDVGLLTRDASALPSPHPAGHHKMHDDTQGRKKVKGTEETRRTGKKSDAKHSDPPVDPSPEATDPSPAAPAVAGAALRWDFSTDEKREPGPYPPYYIGDAEHSPDRGGSLTCDGSGYLQTDRAVVDMQGSFTVSVWVRPTSRSGFQTVAAQDGHDVSGFFLQYSDTADRWRLALGHEDSTDADESQVLSVAAPALNQWQHLTAVVDADAQQIRLYVNGILQGTARDAHTWSSVGAFTLGRGLWDGEASDAWHGGIDDVRVYLRALGPSEVGALAKAAPNA